MNGKFILGIKNLSFMGLWTELDMTGSSSEHFASVGIEPVKFFTRAKEGMGTEQKFSVTSCA